jgi:lysophospholipase L1-like esterase
MPRILCYGDSNTWGFASVPEPPAPRYPRAERWPGVLADALGPDFEVIEEGLNGRTTDLADPTHPEIGGAGLNGLDYLPACLASHLPLDLVIIALGTNDLKAMYARAPLRIALGAARLLEAVTAIGAGVGTPYDRSPDALLICPPPLGEMSHFADMFAGGHEKARALPALYAQVAALCGAGFLDAGRVIHSDGADGLHWTAAKQRALGQAVAEAARARLSLTRRA